MLNWSDNRSLNKNKKPEWRKFADYYSLVFLITPIHWSSNSWRIIRLSRLVKGRLSQRVPLFLKRFFRTSEYTISLHQNTQYHLS
jgi:hypothetical protein